MSNKKKSGQKQQINEGDKLKELGNAQLHLEQYDKAIEYYTKAIKEDDKNYAYFHNRSLAYYLLENFQKSLEDIQICKQLNKDYIQVYIREASAYHQLDELEKAQQSVTEGLAIEPANEQLTNLKNTIQDELAQQKQEQEKNGQDQTSELLKWISNHSGEFSRIKLTHQDSNNRSVVSRRVIQTDEKIISIPSELVITFDIAKQTPYCQSLTFSKVNLSSKKHVYFALFILQEKQKGEQSSFNQYIKSLPKEFSQFPAFFKEEELQWLEGTATLKLVQEQKEDIKQDYEIICQISEEFKKSHTFEEFLWAYLCSQSRVLSIETKGQKTSVMVPLADMLNHNRSGSEEAEWVYDDASNSFIVKALKRIPRHAQIHFSYGSKCNSKLFVNYGFVEMQNQEKVEVKQNDEEIKEDNAKKQKQVEIKPDRTVIKTEFKGINYYNEYPVFFCFDEIQDDQTLPLKAKLIGGAIPKCCLIRINEDFETQNSTGFLGYLRFICIRDQLQLVKLMESHKKFTEQTNQQNLPFLPQKTPPLSVENEYKMWTRVQELLVPLLLKCKTSVVKDQELLASGQLTENERNCVIIRLGEKNILEYYIDMASKMMYLLENKEKKEILESARTDPKYLPYFHYIIQVILARLLYKK